MALIVDASVAIKWFVDEPGADRARILWQRRADLIAPDLLIPEVCSAMWRKVRLRQAVPDQAAEAADRLRTNLVELRPTAALARAAMALAFALDHPVYDCFYLALAELERSSMVTADQRLLARLAGSKFEVLAGQL
jgi:predicted nucleic acid-binding protein